MKKDFNKDIQIIVNRFKNRDYDYTINKSTILLKKIPNNDLLWNLKGLSLQTLGNLKESINCFLMALKANSKK